MFKIRIHRPTQWFFHLCNRVIISISAIQLWELNRSITYSTSQSACSVPGPVLSTGDMDVVIEATSDGLNWKVQQSTGFRSAGPRGSIPIVRTWSISLSVS